MQVRSPGARGSWRSRWHSTRRVVRSAGAAAWLGLAGAGCAGSEQSEPEPDVGGVAVEIGLPSEDGRLGFVPLEPGGEVRLETFGQGGTHVLLAVRCIGFGDRAFVNVSLTNSLTGARVAAPPPASPQLLLCRDERSCDLLPLLVMASGLTPPGEQRDGLPVRIDVEVNNTEGERARAEVEAVLRGPD